MIYFHAERRAAFSGVIPLKRYDPLLNRWGTPIWTNVEFTTGDGSYLLQTSGKIMIKHLYTVVPELGSDYSIMANARVGLVSAPTLAELPITDVPPTEAEVITLSGGNILNMEDHYFNAYLNAQVMLQPNKAYRVSVWASSGGDPDNWDGLGGMGSYNAGNIHQFNACVWKL